MDYNALLGCSRRHPIPPTTLLPSPPELLANCVVYEDLTNA
jgi:hypothetical protein